MTVVSIPCMLVVGLRALSHENKLILLKNSKLFFNFLKPSHFVKMCRSNQYCKACQGPHHTLLHVEPTVGIPKQSNQINPSQNVQSHTVSELNNSTLLMTSCVLTHSPSGPSIEARAVLDSASCALFVSE